MSIAGIGLAVPAGIVVLWFLSGIRIVNEHEQGVVLRLGRFAGVRSAGLTWIVPFIDRMVIIDMRVADRGGAAGAAAARGAALLGAEGEALGEVGPGGGQVFIHGQYWQARSETAIPKGGRVRVAAVDRLTLTVVSKPRNG